jgi:hypothetical protein
MTIELMFVLKILLGLKSMQGNVTCAFLHADLEEGKNVYVEMPAVFSQYGENGKRRYLSSRRLFTGSVRVPEHSGSISPSNLRNVV